MSNSIVVSHNPFAVNSMISICNGDMVTEQVMVPSGIGELAYNLVSLAYTNDAFDIEVHSPDQFYEELAETIGREEGRRYSERKININLL